MKITKTSKNETLKNARRIRANMGCYVCPCCGETKSALEYIDEDIYDKGIFSGVSKEWSRGIFQLRNMRIDCYSCRTCGAQWESDAYEM